jgi:hypothetical protein
MKPTVSQLVNSCFHALVEKHGLRQIEEMETNEAYSTKFVTTNFVVKLEKYRTDIYATLLKSVEARREMDLFNLVDYLRSSSVTEIVPDYGIRDEGGISEGYRKHLGKISSALMRNFTAIDGFFAAEDFERSAQSVDKFMIDKYPDLFRTR